MCGAKDDALGHHAIPHQVPQGDEQLARQSDDHLLSRAAAVLGARSKPLGQRALLLKVEKAPGELDHPPPHPSVAGSGKPLLAALAPAFIGRAREAGVACHGASVAQVPRQDLFDQHVRRLDPHADDADQHQDHQIWSRFRGLLQLLQAGLLDLTYLLADKPPALHIAAQFGERVGRDRFALRRAQMLQALRRLLELGIEVADTKPDQGRLEAVDNTGLLTNEGLALAVGAFGIFLCAGRIAAILQCSRSPRSQPRNARFKPSVSRRSVLARRCSRDTATLAA